MNWLDIVILCLVGAGLIKGLRDGAIKQVISFLALFAGIFFCGRMANWMRMFITSWGLSDLGASVLSHVIGFLIILGGMVLIAEIMHRLIDATPLSIFNHLGGGFVGLLLMILFLSLLFNLLEVVDPRSLLIPNEAKIESRFFLFIKQIVPAIFPKGIFSLPE
ncbi:MAG: CvpA family protein [Tannerellaceae bacterium]|jgi:membrane protein required for colicin V production|nr:CvpA family protein [Tannerellaceae bacterium]